MVKMDHYMATAVRDGVLLQAKLTEWLFFSGGVFPFFFLFFSPFGLKHYVCCPPV